MDDYTFEIMYKKSLEIYNECFVNIYTPNEHIRCLCSSRILNKKLNKKMHIENCIKHKKEFISRMLI